MHVRQRFSGIFESPHKLLIKSAMFPKQKTRPAFTLKRVDFPIPFGPL
jgi:hypothetical protein